MVGQDRCLRCGRCCRLLGLAATRQQLYQGRHSEPDGATIYNMLRRVARKDAVAIDPTFDVKRMPAGLYLYCCTKLGPDGLCTIYSQRPRMCREYPYYGGDTHRARSASLRPYCGFPLKKPETPA